MQVRDVSTRPEWSQKYAMEVPVLAALQGGGGGAGPATEVELPRPPPRITADRLQKHIESAMQALSL